MEEVATKILSDRHCHLGEGCTYDPATDTAWWFDILERTLFQADLASGAVTAHALPWMASVVAFIDDQRQLLATENGLYVRDIADGRLTLHAAAGSGQCRHPFQRWAGPRQRRALDRDHGPQGRKGRGCDLSFWRRRTAQALCRHFASRMRSAFRPMALRPISPTAAKASFIASRSIPRTACRPAIPRRCSTTAAGWAASTAPWSMPKGLIWNARWGGSCIDAYSPEGRAHPHHPGSGASSRAARCLSAANFDRLLVTSGLAGHGRAGQSGRPAPWPNLHSRRRCTGAAGTSHQARPAMTDRLAASHMRSS